MKYINLGEQYRFMEQEIDAQIKEVMQNADFILGEKEKEFEKAFAEYLGVKHVIGCSDGTAALQLVYMAYNIGKGDAVFCPDMTFIASIEPACLLGATPVFCDIRKDTYNIDCKSLVKQIEAVKNEGKLTPKAIVAVDFLGNPADFDELKQIAAQYKLLLIEDAAQGTGGWYKGNHNGIMGDIGTTSFFPTKPLGGYGDGGAVMTNNDIIAEKIRTLRVHGKGIDKYHNIALGINSRLDTIQAAVLNVKLKYLDKEIKIRQEKAKFYNEGLKDQYIIPWIDENNVCAYAQYVIIPKKDVNREHLLKRLKENGIPTILYYPTPMHKLPVFEGINVYEESYENTNWYADHSFGIPFSPYITTKEQQTVIDCLMGV